KQGNKTIELQWLVNQQLLRALTITTSHNGQLQSQHWQLISSSENSAAIEAQFRHWDRYITTDYADIGDNEADPFLTQMIHLGFRGND
ncbi:MAG: hypothetical protein ACI8WB_006029, partial [Phenylobacterium sp.]